MAGASTTTARPVARLNARLSAYLVDSIVLLAFVLVFFVISGAVLLFIGGSLLSWTAFNLALMRWRGQTAGMYIIGIQAVGRDGLELTPARILLRWFGLHPLLFHPFLLPVWGVLSLLTVSVTLSQIVLVVSLALVLLCIVSPAVSLLLVVIDAERRALHDRLAHTLVVYLEQP